MREGAGGVGGLRRLEAEARQGLGQQAVLPGPQRVAALAAVEPVSRRLDRRRPDRRWGVQRLNAAFSAGTKSVFSQVKVPFSASGSRPKWP